MSNDCRKIQPGSVTTIRGERVAPTVYNHFPTLTSCGLGTVQVCCSVALLVLGIMCWPAVLAVYSFELFTLAVIGGSFGIAAGRTKTSCKIVTHLVMSIMATGSSISIFIMSAILLNTQRQLRSLDKNFDVKQLIPMATGVLIALMLFSLIEACAALIGSIVGCHFTCFCCRKCCCQYNVTSTEKFVVEATDGGQLQQVHVVQSSGYKSNQN
jgi:hypothetical protein